MTRLSVNINKVALIRNSRGANYPNLLKVAQDCEAFGAEGITVHPRPDQRHIRYDDIPVLKNNIKTEFNIEGNPTKEFVEMVLANPPHQVTLVPDKPGALTSDTGWDTIEYASLLKDLTKEFHSKNIRVSVFVDPIPKMLEAAKQSGIDRVEFYTGPYAANYAKNRENAIADFELAANFSAEIGLGLNAGHDLNLENLAFFKSKIKNLLEVSIGHAIICDSLYYGLENTIQMYLNRLK